ncbi:MAG: hypothetical protein ACW980_24130 [Promethearchaeota archaeon]|jgi:hypothetical protein
MPDDLDNAIQKLAEQYCSEGNSDQQRLKEEIESNIIAAVQLDQNIEKEIAFCRGMVHGAYISGAITEEEYHDLQNHPIYCGIFFKLMRNSQKKKK